MRLADREIAAVLAANGVIARRRYPDLQWALRRLLERGELAPVLPGVYAPTETATTFVTRIAALECWDPDAVVTGAAAARLTFWRDLRVEEIECAVLTARPPQPGFRMRRRQIPPELITTVNGIRLAAPELTALDLCATLGGDPIDHALRSRMTTLDRLNHALELTGGRRANTVRKQLLLDSRGEPWSAAERKAHRELRSAGIDGWRANCPVVIRGQLFYLDVGFEHLRIDVEIDGREHHIGREVFETDRWRQNLLVLEGWLVLRFTWNVLDERPDEMIGAIREALDQRVAGLRTPQSITRRTPPALVPRTQPRGGRSSA